MKIPSKFTYLDISPNGPGLVVEVDGEEIFIPAVEVANAMGALGYMVFTPPSISTRAENCVVVEVEELVEDDS